MESMKLLYLLYIVAYANMHYGITSTTPGISDIDDYDAKASISETILGNSSNTLESAATDYLVQSFDKGADGCEPRKLRRVPKKKSQSKKGGKNPSAKNKAPRSSTSKRVGAKGNKKNKSAPRVKPPTPDATTPVYARYKASIRDPKHFYVSQVKFDGGLGSEETVYLYFNTPLSESDMKGLLKRSRVEILGSDYDSIKVEDMNKLDPVDSKMSWIYDEKERKFYRFKTAPGRPTNTTGDVDKSDETALKEVDPSITSIDDTAESETPESPVNSADDVAMPHVDEDGLPVPTTADNSDATNMSDEGYDSSLETASNISNTTDELAENEISDLSTNEESELPIDDAASTVDSIDGTTTEVETATSDAESDKETSENNTTVVSNKVSEKRRKGSKKNKKNSTTTTGSYDLVDEDGNPVDRSQYKETIDDEIASDINADGAPIMMTGYKSLDSEETLDSDSAGSATNKLEERKGNIKGDAPKSPRGRGNRRKPATLWPRRRIQNEVIRTKKKVVNLEKRLGQAEEKIETIVRV